MMIRSSLPWLYLLHIENSLVWSQKIRGTRNYKSSSLTEFRCPDNFWVCLFTLTDTMKTLHNNAMEWKGTKEGPWYPPPPPGGLGVSGAQRGGGLAVKGWNVAAAPPAPVNHPAGSITPHLCNAGEASSARPWIWGLDSVYEILNPDLREISLVHIVLSIRTS